MFWRNIFRVEDGNDMLLLNDVIYLRVLKVSQPRRTASPFSSP
jgi:hypothetical protein